MMIISRRFRTRTSKLQNRSGRDEQKLCRATALQSTLSLQRENPINRADCRVPGRQSATT